MTQTLEPGVIHRHWICSVTAETHHMPCNPDCILGRCPYCGAKCCVVFVSESLDDDYPKILELDWKKDGF